jgi:hypothetical protein
MKVDQIAEIIKIADLSKSKWELDNIIYWDRSTNPVTLINFLERIQELKTSTSLTKTEETELKHLIELLKELDYKECKELFSQDDDQSKDYYLESLARTAAIETLTSGKLSFETMTTACKLSPNDFIIVAKRTQDLIQAIHGLVIKGEALSKDVAGA